MQHPKTWRKGNSGHTCARPGCKFVTCLPRLDNGTSPLLLSRWIPTCRLIFWEPPPVVLRAVLMSFRHVTGKRPNHGGLYPWSYPSSPPQATGVYIFVSLCWILTSFPGTQILTFTAVEWVCVCAPIILDMDFNLLHVWSGETFGSFYLGLLYLFNFH